MTTIGSGDQADLQVPDPSLDPLHARLDLRQGVWTLTPLSSGALGLVDGEPVQGEFPLSPGSTIRLGAVDVLFEPRDQTPAEGFRRAIREADAEVAKSAPPPRKGRAGFVLAVMLGVVLVLGGLALEFLS